MRRVKRLSVLVISLFILNAVKAQNMPTAYSEKDSLFFSKPYPFILPIWGNKVHAKEIKLPFPVGVMFNSLVGTQTLGINEIALGFGNLSNSNEAQMIDLDDVIVFDDIEAQTSTFNLRADAWILPFLDVYGIVGQTKKADINVILKQPFPLDVSTEVSGTYIGFGAMLAGAIGPIFLSLDGNRTYNYNPRLDDPAVVSIGGLRLGPVFRFQNNPDMNITLWTGAMYTHFNGETNGRIRANELAPDASGRITELQGELDNWYNGLSAIEQSLYENLYNKLVSGLTDLQNGVENGFIQYSFNKSVENPWNMLVGAQWQINHRWQIRTEGQFLGDRIAGLFSLNYRFGIKGKNWFSE